MKLKVQQQLTIELPHILITLFINKLNNFKNVILRYIIINILYLNDAYFNIDTFPTFNFDH